MAVLAVFAVTSGVFTGYFGCLPHFVWDTLLGPHLGWDTRRMPDIRLASLRAYPPRWGPRRAYPTKWRKHPKYPVKTPPVTAKVGQNSQNTRPYLPKRAIRMGAQ